MIGQRCRKKAGNFEYFKYYIWHLSPVTCQLLKECSLEPYRENFYLMTNNEKFQKKDKGQEKMLVKETVSFLIQF